MTVGLSTVARETRANQLASFKAIAAGTLIAAVIWIGLSASAVWLPRAPIDRALVAAFDAGTLTADDSALGDARRGAAQFADCIILGAAYFRTGTLLEDFASPVRPVHTREDDRDGEGACGTLRSALKGNNPFGDLGFERYHRYLFGQRGVAAGALQVMSLDSLRLSLSVATHGLAILMILWGLLALVRERARGMALVFGGTALLLFFELRYFGQSIAHAPGDSVGILLLLWILARNTSREWEHDNTVLAVLALFGGLTAIFELMIGPLPIGVTAVLLGYAWDASRRSLDAGPAWRNAARGLGAFFAGFLALFAIKLIVAITVYGPGVLADFSANLLSRAGFSAAEASSSRLVMTWDALTGLRGSITTLFFGNTLLAYLAVGLGALAALTALARARRAEAVLFTLAMLAVPGWFIAFPDHTVRHGWFMARICIWPLIVAGVFLIATLHATSKRSSGAGNSIPIRTAATST